MIRKLALLGLLLFLLCFGTAGVLLTHRPAPVRAYDRIKLGMTLPEVTTAIGVASGEYTSPSSFRPFAEWVRETGDSRRFPLSKVVEENWLWDDYAILVYFDEDGTVVGYYLAERSDGEGTLGERFRALVGL